MDIERLRRLAAMGDPPQTIPAAWEKLYAWCEDSKYRFASHQWLEEHLRTAETPPGDFTLDLYMPIAEQSDAMTDIRTHVRTRSASRDPLSF